MQLPPGTRLGSYEIVDHIGAGGMGDVYRARDTRLDRTVALKVVRRDFSERFEREAKAISALNHPHICALYDVGSETVPVDGAGAPPKVDFLVMEFVEGRPVTGPMPVADVLRIGRQICEALDAAHKKGIVHRDLKPANVMVAKGGVKLLDFGLAKAQPTDPGRSSAEEVTVAALTGAHTIVGTPQYMSPEQIEGREADARSDIFALGCVLYELLTGQRAFDGKTTSNVMAAVLATEPRKVTELVPLAPATLEWVVQRCLAKDPDARWQSAADVGMQLQWLADQPSASGVTVAEASPSRGSWLGGLAAGIIIAGLAAAGWVWMRPSTTGPMHTASATLDLPDGFGFQTPHEVPAIALSPDGETLVFSLIDEKGDAALYVRPLAGFSFTRIAGSEGVVGGAAFSPDGQWLAYQRRGEVVKIPVAGGVAARVCDSQQLRGLAWLSDDTLLVAPTATSGLMRVSADGGPLQPLTQLNPERHEKTHRTPVVLPGGDTFLMTVGTDDTDTYNAARIVAVSLKTGDQTDLVTGGYAPAYSPTGHLLYVRDLALYAVPFDPQTLAVGRTPVKIADDIAAIDDYGTAQYTVGPRSLLLFATGGGSYKPNSLIWADRSGTVEPLGLPDQDYDDVQFSPDGTRVLVLFSGANQFYWIYDIAQRQLVPLTHRYDALDGIWTPDGTHVTYSVGSEIRSIAADGSGDRVLVPASAIGGRVAVPTSWTPDGKTLVLDVRSLSEPTGNDIMTWSADTGELTPLIATPFEETDGVISPDGRWLAYVSNDAGDPRIYLRALSGSPTRYPVAAGRRPTWTSKGLVYFTRGVGLQIVPIRLGDTPEIGRPVSWGPMPELPVNDISMQPDAARLIAVQLNMSTPVTSLDLILNWTGGPIAGR